MTRQRARRLAIVASLLLFPVTLYYFSPVLIVNAAFDGVMNGSFVVFVAMLVLSPVFGRVFCAYACPGAGLQEVLFAASDRRPRQGWRNRIKYVIWGIWIATVVAAYVFSGHGLTPDILYQTKSGVSVMEPHAYIIYYGIVLLILVPALFGGRRTFCHYFCWMAPFMVLGSKVGDGLRLPRLRIIAAPDRCLSCKLCNEACPMSVDVRAAVRHGGVFSAECIQCGMCVDSCRAGVLSYQMTRRRANHPGLTMSGRPRGRPARRQPGSATIDV